jgi:hypothetical protein
MIYLSFENIFDILIVVLNIFLKKMIGDITIFHMKYIKDQKNLIIGVTLFGKTI